jgi:hypothetical protein
MKESEAKRSVYILLIAGTLASAFLAPPEIRLYTIFGYIGLFGLVAYFRDGVFFGQRVYPWGIKYSTRSQKRSGLFRKKPAKRGKQHHKRRS